MNTAAQKKDVCQEEKELQKVEEYLADIEPEKFWEVMVKMILHTFCLDFERIQTTN